MRVLPSLLALLLAVPAVAGDAAPKDEAAAKEEAKEEAKIGALHLGVTGDGGRRILAETVVRESSTVTLGSAETDTLRIDAAHGLSGHVVIRDGALIYRAQDTVAAYRKGEAVVLPNARPPKPLPIKESLLMDVGDVRLMIRRVWATEKELARPRAGD